MIQPALQQFLHMCRLVQRQAFRVRHFVKIVNSRFEPFEAALRQVDQATSFISAEETARLIVRDFVAAQRWDEDAQAALRDWIADAILAAVVQVETKNGQRLYTAHTEMDPANNQSTESLEVSTCDAR